MKTAALEFVLIVFVLFAGISEIFACSCRQPDSVCSQLKEIKNPKNQEAVFVGAVKSVKQIEITGTEDGETFIVPVNKVLFEVKENFGEKIGKTEFVYTSVSGASCGYDFEIGKKYLVFAAYIKELKKYSTGLCAGNKELEAAENDVKLLREFSKTGKITPMIYGTVNYLPEKRDASGNSKNLFKITAQKQGSDIEIEKSIESGNRFDFSNLQFGEYRFKILIDDVTFKISQPVILSQNEACREIEISASEKDLKAIKTSPRK